MLQRPSPEKRGKCKNSIVNGKQREVRKTEKAKKVKTANQNGSIREEREKDWNE